jgi:hypothetical protein
MTGLKTRHYRGPTSVPAWMLRIFTLILQLYIITWYDNTSAQYAAGARELCRTTNVFRDHLLRPAQTVSGRGTYGEWRAGSPDRMRREQLFPTARILLDAGSRAHPHGRSARSLRSARIYPCIQATDGVYISKIARLPAVGNELSRAHSAAFGFGRGRRRVHMVESCPERSVCSSCRFPIFGIANDRLDAPL